MKKRLTVLLITSLVLGSILTGCESEEESNSSDLKVEQEKLDDEVNLSEEDVIERVSFIPTILDIEVSDPEENAGVTDSLDDCSLLVYFSSDLVDQDDFEEKSTAEKGTACGGSIEIFETETAAKERDEYLAGTLISMMSPGTHTVKDKIVVRISKNMTEKQQQEFEDLVFTVLTTSDANELLDVKKFTFSDYDPKDSEKAKESNSDNKKDQEEMQEGKAKTPEPSYFLEDDNYEDVVKVLKGAGFDNIKTQAIYDLNTGAWDSASYECVEKVSIDGKTDFDEDQFFDKNVEVIVSFHAYEKDNPNIVYNSYSANELLKDLDDNPMRAEKKHMNEYVELTGKISRISKQGSYILMHDVKGEFALDTIYCDMITDELEEHLLELTTGEEVTIRGKITVVDTVYPYSIDVYSFR